MTSLTTIIFRENNGLCGKCGKPRQDLSKNNCNSCREKVKISSKKIRRKRIDNNVCSYCGLPNDRQGLTCSKCRKLKSEERNTAASNNLCNRCRKPNTNGNKNCGLCLKSLLIGFKFIKEIVIKKYGGSCICCSENIICFLAIDHIDGGGNKHIKSVGKLYNWLVRKDFPPGFQTLCFNCNTGKQKNKGICPKHK